MYSATKAFSLLAIIGTAVATPIWGQWNRNGYMQSHPENTDAAVSPTSTFSYAAPTITSTLVVVTTQAVATTTQVEQFTKAAATSAVPAKQTSAPVSSNGDYISVVNQYRALMGKSNLSQDSKLEANALKTATDDAGTMSHELNPGSMAQVLAPGDSGEFTHCFLGGWLCEIPSLLPAGTCNAAATAGWSYDGTGHAEILSSSSYSKIGCAWATGIWACDLA